jgi:hypothetical protein
MPFVLVPILAVVAVLIAFGISFFVRRHGESEGPGPDWRPTDEVFNDPSTNRLMRVWLDPRGDRHYVAEGQR